jgi:hypothetical protein
MCVGIPTNAWIYFFLFFKETSGHNVCLSGASFLLMGLMFQNCRQQKMVETKRMVAESRVARLGQFSPLGRLGSFSKKAEIAIIFGIRFSTVKKFYINSVE